MTLEYAALVQQVEQCRREGRLRAAEGALRTIVQLNPREHYAWGLLGMAALQRGEAAAAVAEFERAAALDRRNPQYLNLLGVALGELGRYEDALAALRKALRAAPDYAEAHFNAGKVHEKRGDPAAAREAFRRAASIDPRYPGARYMYARALLQAGDLAAAEAVLEAAIADEARDDWSAILLGKVSTALRGSAAGIGLLRDAAARIPESGALARELAHALLAAGEFRSGWEAYLRRDVAGPAPRGRLPERLPANLVGRSFVLQPEQGLGDVLFFLRFAPALAERGAHVSAAAPPKLRSLLERCATFVLVTEAGAAPPAGAEPALIGDLPYLVGQDTAAPTLRLAPLGARVEAWRARLAAFGAGPYIGVAWRAGTDFRRQAEFGANVRSLFKAVPHDVLVAALRRQSGTIVSLQRLPDPGETEALARRLGRPVFDASAVNEDLEDALALLAVLDDYLGVSNTNVHLLAALGKRGRVLVPHPAEWRWMAAGDRSVWFPHWRVVRQRADRSWPSVDSAFADAPATEA